MSALLRNNPDHLALARDAALCHGARVNQRTPIAGGCFLMATILIGFVGGMATGNALRGTLVGTGVGIAIAVILWLVDRSRR